MRKYSMDCEHFVYDMQNNIYDLLNINFTETKEF